jgi:hypothetical protein
VQIDGMGTANRSKAFHDVAFKNLKDAGFPDRILWHQAVARKYPGMTSRASALRRIRRRTELARRAVVPRRLLQSRRVAFAGRHDNRMDKIW